MEAGGGEDTVEWGTRNGGWWWRRHRGVGDPDSQSSVRWRGGGDGEREREGEEGEMREGGRWRREREREEREAREKGWGSGDGNGEGERKREEGKARPRSSAWVAGRLSSGRKGWIWWGTVIGRGGETGSSSWVVSRDSSFGEKGSGSMAKTQGGQLDRCLALGLNSATAKMLGGRNSVTMKAGIGSCGWERKGVVSSALSLSFF
ncbi:hypothetical protein TIFTF001_012231 [Ficus carica]|uniref:Uncharacterized protein n=1 Tax=Ficus carica TaxID=3494 RepID=A0AA87ZZN9_FICCA|nr:hypothetical protein TIFTF001_012231 [Ficus carica]